MNKCKIEVEDAMFIDKVMVETHRKTKAAQESLKSIDEKIRSFNIEDSSILGMLSDFKDDLLTIECESLENKDTVMCILHGK